MSTNGVNSWRTQSMYTFAEAAQLAHVSASTVRNWLFGYATKDRMVVPLFKTSPATQGAMVSFIQLVEVVVAGRFRKSEHVSLQTVRTTYANARNEWQIDYPFAHLRLEALGGHIVRRLHDERPGVSLQAVDSPAQWTLPGLVLEIIQQLDYEQDLAARWYPVGRDVPIVVDPRISAGIPTFVGRGVTVETVHRRWLDGDTLAFLARDFEMEPVVIEKAMRYAEKVKIAV